MHSKWSLEQKMTNLLVVFGVFPLCVMACIMLSLRWQTHVSEDIQHKQYILDNISADARMVASHTESVVRAFADSEALVDLLSARSNAEWSIQFRDGVYPEISKAEMYLSSLHANIMVIFDRDDISQEHWAMLLDAERFANDESYQNFVQSGKYAGWYGVSSVMPESIAGVYDFRNMGEKFTYYCRVNTGVGRSLGVIKCAVDSRTFIDSALLRADNSAMYIFSGDSALYAADDQCDESMRAEFSVNDCIRADGSLWQHMRIADLDLDVILRTNVKTLFLEYVYASSGMLILIVAAIILLFSLARKVLVSLLTRFKRIALAADSINTKDGRVHLPEDGEDEVGHVVRAFNSLFDRLDKQMEENIGKEKAKRHMQALALQYQLNPHFLFNSLLWLQMKLEDQGVEKRISRSITSLGSVLRYNLSESLDSTLEQEAEHLKAYIDFM